MASSAGHESLYDRIDRLVRSRGLLALGGVAAFLRFAVEGVSDILHADSDIEMRAAYINIGVAIAVVAGLAVAMVVLGRSAARKRARSEQLARNIELSMAAETGGDRRIRADGSIRRGDWPSLDTALSLYHAAIGRAVYPRLERIPRISAGDRFDACVRSDGDEPVLRFTPVMLETASADELLAAIAHLIERHRIMKSLGSCGALGVREADAKTLLLTKDHRSLLESVEKSRAGVVPGLAATAGSEAWFSEDDQEPDRYEDGSPVSWKRIDRLVELRKHLRAMALDVPEGGTRRGVLQSGISYP